jgi:hypothetical protein
VTWVVSEAAGDRRPVAPQPAGDLADAQTDRHQTAPAASLLKREVVVVFTHGDSGQSRCRTWLVSLVLTVSPSEINGYRAILYYAGSAPDDHWKSNSP